MSTDTGENLLNPGDTPHDNAQFLVFCAAVIRAVNKYAEILRLSIASAAQRSPPGRQRSPAGDHLHLPGRPAHGHFRPDRKRRAPRAASKAASSKPACRVLPKLPKDAGDRNRTSPFAFTGNKFEFRAVGSSANIAGPNTVLNTIVAESLDYIATKLEADVKAGKDLNKAIQELLPTSSRKTSRSSSTATTTPRNGTRKPKNAACPTLRTRSKSCRWSPSKDTIELFTKYKVYTEKELHSRFNILAENYIKT